LNIDEKNKVQPDKITVEELHLQIKNLSEGLIKEREKAEDYLSRLRYLQADFDNYQKRMLKQSEDIVKYAAEKLIVRLLDILDDLERAINVGKEIQDKESLLHGINLIFQEFNKILEKEGLRTIDCVGMNFNPNEHEAVEKIESEKHPDNTIIEECRKGYTLRGKVIRPSTVKVVKNTSENNKNNKGEKEEKN
jgi:molecular chaperone GrpE